VATLELPNELGEDDVPAEAKAWLERELAGILRQPREERGSGPHGMPGDAEIAELRDIARRAREEADAQEALPPGQVRAIPEPLGAVIKFLDSLDERPEWIATAALAAACWGKPEKSTAFGQALARVPTIPKLSSTEGKDYPAGPGYPAGRGRGFVVAELYAAAERFRTGG
jgi:hypothetical protein